MPRKKEAILLVGMRVKESVIKEIDALVADHARLEDGVIWSRSDALRALVVRGMPILREELELRLAQKSV